VKTKRPVPVTNTLVLDLDGTLAQSDGACAYEDARPRPEVIRRAREYSERGFRIAIFTSRNMRTFSGQIGRINAVTVPTIVDWLRAHDVPFDELHVGKPWCGENGFYVDDRAIRPGEFANLGHDEIAALLKRG
jgi:capsule biosynthesis phosphatase